MSLFETRVTVSAPDVVQYPNPVDISGYAYWFCPDFMCPPFGQWQPYSGITLDVIVDGVKRSSVVTGEDGSFSTQLQLPVGVHRVEVYYPGSWKDAPSSAYATVKVLSPQEYNQYVQQQDMTYFLAGLGVVVGLFVLKKVLE